MWATKLFLGILGISAGFAVAGGLFALIIGLGVISRFAGKTHTGYMVKLYEDCVAAGGIFGNLMCFYTFPLPGGNFTFIIFGLFSGMFVGSWYMALTEMVNTFPIFSRRIKLLKGMGVVVLSLGIGKTIGAFIYFWNGW